MKIYIIGAGGIGGYFGGILANSDCNYDVTFVARGENYKALKENGLMVKSVVGDFKVNPVRIINDISEISDPDLIIISVKTYDTETVAKKLASVVTGKTVILTFQNGVDNDDQLKKIIKNAEIFPGVAYIITTKIKPGIIAQTGGLRKLIFGDRNNPRNPRLTEIEKLMKNAGIDGTSSDDITRDIWKKFMFICPFSGLTALHRKTIGEIISAPETRKQYETCLKETIAVAKALRVNISDNAFDEIMKVSVDSEPASKSSLLIDIENGRKNEIETLNGTLVKIAAKLSIPVPLNELIYKEISKINFS
jgi:2-dehydropantoate 2-reductase